MAWVISDEKPKGWVISDEEVPQTVAGAAWKTLGNELAGGMNEVAKAPVGWGPTSALPVNPDLSLNREEAIGRYAEPGLPQLATGAMRMANAPFAAIGSGVEQAAENAGAPAWVSKGLNLGSTVGSAALAGLASRAITPAIQQGAQYTVPGVGEVVKQAGIQEVRDLPGSFLKSIRLTPQQEAQGITPAKMLYDMAGQNNPPPLKKLPNLLRTAKELEADEEMMKKWSQESQDIIRQASAIQTAQRPTITQTVRHNPNVLNAAGQPITQASTATQYPQIPFREIKKLKKEIGKQIDALEDPFGKHTGHDELGAMKRLDASLMQDMDAVAVKSPNEGMGLAWRMLRRADKEFSREKGAKELVDSFDKGIFPVQGANMPETPNFANMIKAYQLEMRKNKFIAQAFTPEELQQVDDTLEKLRRLPQARLAAGQKGGSATYLGPAAVMGGIGSWVAPKLGVDAKIGAGLGVLSAKKAADMFANFILKSQGRRDFVMKLVSHEPGIFNSPYGFAILSAAERAGAFNNED